MKQTAALLAFAAALSAAAQVAPQPSANGLTLTVALDRSSYVAGSDDLQIEVRVENTGDKEQEVVIPAFDERSVSFRIKAVWNGKSKEFDFAGATPDPHVSLRLAPMKAVLAKGKSLSMVHRLAAVAPGTIEIQAVYQNGAQRLVSTAARAEVTGSSLAATLDTTSGPIKINLDPESSPAGVINFVTLARRGFYDDMIFHRVIKGSWIHSGCPYGLGLGGPGYALRCEAGSSVHDEGSVSLSTFEKSGYAGSQFFICLSRQPSLDGKYPSIGKVDAAGIETLQAVGKVEVDRNTDRPKTDVKLKKVTIAAK